MIDWREDVLGDEFECTDLQLGEDDEGPLVATLVRSLPARHGFWDRVLGREGEFEHCDILYVHGWSDYFFQKHLARFFTERGARFFALDLRKYGRSIREGQTPCFIENLDDYDAEIDAAVSIIRDSADASGPSGPSGRAGLGEGGVIDSLFGSARRSDRKLVLLGHSTGGLVLSLWASRNPGTADALVLNSPWLELQLSGAARGAMAAVVNVRARLSPHDIALPQLDLGFYAQAQKMSSSPEMLAGVNQAWRPEHTIPVRAAWLRAILAGHSRVAEGLDIDAPVCVLLSRKTQFGFNWNESMASSDTVLEVEGVARAALKLGSSVTVERIDGAIHDVFLSRSDARDEAFARMRGWLRGWQLAQSLTSEREG